MYKLKEKTKDKKKYKKNDYKLANRTSNKMRGLIYGEG